MSFLAKLSIDNDVLTVMSFSISFDQAIDTSGRPSQRPLGGIINLLVESTSKTDFLEWMISSSMMKTGEIVFYKRDNLSSLKTVKFFDAYCIHYSEEFSATDSSPLQTRLTISSKKIQVKDTTFENEWPMRE